MGTHQRMVVNTLTKRHGKSVAMVRKLRDGVKTITDEDKEPANRQVEPAQTVEWDRRNAVEVISHN